MCFCDQGFEGANCSAALGCKNECSGHGSCTKGTCYCEEGFQADDCSVALAKGALSLRQKAGEGKEDLVEPPAIVAITCATLVLSFLVGLAFKVVAEQKRRARLIKYIQESDAQAPFVSGELQDSMAYRK